ncbi:GGDEF domain-containing protein [Salinicola halophilus]|uniref:GGDEF domain-containing protein n=1 Tax=Salinicola halophilus TaxID=184065 RepID=UPI000DA22359|nr:sensor domain-containing diguanylate cyclase [Salinicola halophilus]
MTDRALPDAGVEVAPPTLESLNRVDIAALLYRLDAHAPMLIEANACARARLSMKGEDTRHEDAWDWTDAAGRSLAPPSHPALTSSGVASAWHRCHLRLADATLASVQVKSTRFQCRTSERFDDYALIVIGEIDFASLTPVPATRRTDTAPPLYRLLDDLPMGACALDRRGRLRAVNPPFCEFFGYHESELVDAPFEQLLPMEIRELARARHASHFPHLGARRRITDVMTRKGVRRSVLFEDTVCRDDHGDPLHIAFLFDVTSHLKLERYLTWQNQRLEQLAGRDELTALPNRRQGLAMAKRTLIHHRHYTQPMALAMLDLDHFKAINDTYGHAVGDEVLVAFSRLVERTVRSTDTLIRWGGDEFLLLLPGLDDVSAGAAITRVMKTLATARLGPSKTPLGFSAGVGQPADETLEALLRAIDDALYQAKRAGGGRVALMPRPPRP